MSPTRKSRDPRNCKESQSSATMCNLQVKPPCTPAVSDEIHAQSSVQSHNTVCFANSDELLRESAAFIGGQDLELCFYEVQRVHHERRHASSDDAAYCLVLDGLLCISRLHCTCCPAFPAKDSRYSQNRSTKASHRSLKATARQCCSYTTNE